MREFFNNAFHLPISEGGLHELLNRLVAKSTPAYQLIKDKIITSKVIGTDETGAKINGKKIGYGLGKTIRLLLLFLQKIVVLQLYKRTLKTD